ncbi:MAG: FAD-binding oxidoreductase [Actinomycetota bacterium]
MATVHTARGWWLQEAEPNAELPPLEGELDADLVVVGGGYTGMWTAWFVSELDPEARVVLLEAGRCGGGPSGRNGGFVNAMWFSLPALRQRFGDAAALRLTRAAEEAVGEIGRWCEEQRVDAWYRAGGYLQVSTAPAHDGSWRTVTDACSDLGVAGVCRPLSEAEVRSRCDSPIFRAGAFYPVAATVQPARLALGLRARLRERGVSIFEGSRVRRLAAIGQGVEARTDRGSVRAPRAALATGPALAGHRPLRRRLTVTSSHVVITEPVPDVLAELGWTGGECITDSRALVHYFRTTPDGRIVFGWGGGRLAPGGRLNGRVELDRGVVAEVERQLVRFFPALRGRRVEHAWGGPIDVSPTHLPMVGSLHRDRVHYAFGYTGNGVAPSRIAGRILASLALDRRDEVTRLPIVEPPRVRVPPEPLRYAGGMIVRAAVLRRERFEEEGRPPGRLTRAIAGLPDRLGIQLGR